MQRIITESDIFVKYGLTERAGEHLRKVFELQPEHTGARERLAAMLVQLGRKAEAVEELGLLAERLLDSDPAAAEKHLRRALELDPNAVGARRMLRRLHRGDRGRADLDRRRRPRPSWKSWTWTSWSWSPSRAPTLASRCRPRTSSRSTTGTSSPPRARRWPMI